jgi:hypothetical protein
MIFAVMAFNVVNAETVLSNLTRSQRGPDLISANFQMEANEFMTGQTGPFLLNSITLSASIPAGSHMVLSIYTDNGGQIGGYSLGTFTQQQAGHGQDNYTFAAPDVRLSADSAYWLTATTTAGSTGGWYWTEDATADSSYGWTVGAHAYYGSGGWHYFGFWPYSFAMDATVVPEPDETGFVGMALLSAGGFALVRRARVRSSNSAARAI